MKKHGLARHTLRSALAVAVLWWVSPSPGAFLWAATAQQAPSLKPNTPDDDNDASFKSAYLTSLESRIHLLDQEVRKIDSTTTTFTAVGSVLGGLLALTGFIGYWVRWRQQKATLIQYLNNQAPQELRKLLKEHEARLGKQAEAELIRLTGALVLKSDRRYDDALEVLGYDKETLIIKDLAEKPPVLQRLIIECLARARERRTERSEAAWLALNQLIEQDLSVETLRLYLEVGSNTKNYADALERYKSTGLIDLKCEIRAASILRRLNRQEEALARLQQFRANNDFMTLNTLASLHRDLGQSEMSHDLLKPKVLSFIDTFDGRYPSGWEYAFNSYIASCVDLSQPEAALPAVDFILRNSGQSPSSLNSVILAVSRMPDDSKRRAEALDQIRGIVERLPSGVTQVVCTSSLSAMNGEVDAAIRSVKSFLARLSTHSREEDTREVFLRTKMHLGELYLLKGDTQNALAILTDVHAQDDFGGECTFMVARAEAAAGSSERAVEWLRKAAEKKRHWLARARFEHNLRNVPLVSSLLAETVSIRVA